MSNFFSGLSSAASNFASNPLGTLGSAFTAGSQAGQSQQPQSSGLVGQSAQPQMQNDALWQYLQKLMNQGSAQENTKPTVQNPLVKSVNGVS